MTDCAPFKFVWGNLSGAQVLMVAAHWLLPAALLVENDLLMPNSKWPEQRNLSP
jgi:hypothetical protein